MDFEPRIRHLEEEVRRLSALYYSGQPEMSDAEFDALWMELIDLEERNPDLVDADSPTQVVYEGAQALFSPAAHQIPMMSLDKAYSRQEVEHWLKSFQGTQLELMPKFDGVSISLTYSNGQLVRAATRGDGQVGEDVTANVLGQAVFDLPEKISFNGPLELRGELVMRRSDFDAYNQNNPDSPLANPRNAAAGTLRAKDRSKVVQRPLAFMAFEVLADIPGTVLERAEMIGVRLEHHRLTDQKDVAQQIMDYISFLGKQRPNLNYEIDGAVIRLADRSTFQQAGATGHHWRGALAYKLAPEEAETVVEGIDWQVGKSGINAPVLRVRKVFLAGTNISNVSGHNIEMLDQKDIRVGDRIVIVRRGDVIPYAERVADTKARNGSEKPIIAPTTCASCQQALIQVGPSRILKCENAAGCPAQRVRRLIHWASRSAADIDAVGAVWIEKLSADQKLSGPASFYQLNQKDLLGYQRMGTTLAAKMIASIDASRSVGMRRTLIGLSMPLCSEGTAKRLCRAGFKDIEAVMAASQEQLQEVEDIGPLVAEAIVEFFSRPEIIQEMSLLRQLKVNLDCLPEDGPVQSSSALTGKTMVITGTLSVSRSEFAALMEAAGAKISGSVSKNTDYLVCGEKAGSKAKKAEQLGVSVLTEAAAIQLAT